MVGGELKNCIRIPNCSDGAQNEGTEGSKQPLESRGLHSMACVHACFSIAGVKTFLEHYR